MNKIISDTKLPIKVWASELEPEAERQVRQLGDLPFIYKHVAVMPDAHAGKGSTVGTVIATRGAIIPAAVGVDIGCGMCAAKLPFKIDQLGGDAKLKELRHSLERAVPTGHHGNSTYCDAAMKFFVDNGYPKAVAFSSPLQHTRSGQQFGSLGGGNHFIEICRDQDDNAWIMLHSGSRHIGKALAEIHIDKAKGLMKKYFVDLPDSDLAFLAQNTPEFQDYMHDLHWAQEYAKGNRDEMMNRVIYQVARHVYGSDCGPLPIEVRVNCHHNYTQIEHHFGQNVWVTRKGAVSAKKDELGIIPGSMGAKSFIVRGLGNPESFNSCSHGAGRKMSRTKARATFTKEDLEKQTAGVECRKDDGVIDEIPGAYKDIDQVMNDQADLVEPLYTLKQIICIKG